MSITSHLHVVGMLLSVNKYSQKIEKKMLRESYSQTVFRVVKLHIQRLAYSWVLQRHAAKALQDGDCNYRRQNGVTVTPHINGNAIIILMTLLFHSSLVRQRQSGWVGVKSVFRQLMNSPATAPSDRKWTSSDWRTGAQWKCTPLIIGRPAAAINFCRRWVYANLIMHREEGPDDREALAGRRFMSSIVRCCNEWKTARIWSANARGDKHPALQSWSHHRNFNWTSYIAELRRSNVSAVLSFMFLHFKVGLRV